MFSLNNVDRRLYFISKSKTPKNEHYKLNSSVFVCWVLHVGVVLYRSENTKVSSFQGLNFQTECMDGAYQVVGYMGKLTGIAVSVEMMHSTLHCCGDFLPVPAKAIR